MNFKSVQKSNCQRSQKTSKDFQREEQNPKFLYWLGLAIKHKATKAKQIKDRIKFISEINALLLLFWERIIL